MQEVVLHDWVATVRGLGVRGWLCVDYRFGDDLIFFWAVYIGVSSRGARFTEGYFDLRRIQRFNRVVLLRQ